MKRCDLDMIHRGTIYEGHAIFTKQLFLSLFNVATHPIPKVQDPSKQKTIQHVTSTSPCMRSWWAEGSCQHIAPSGRRWEEGSRRGASIDHRVPGARAVRGTAARAPPQRAAGGGADLCRGGCADAADGPWCSRACVDRAGTAAGCWSAGNGSLGCPARTRHLCAVCV